MKYVIALLAFCSLVIGTQSMAGHTKYKKNYKSDYTTQSYGCACGH